MIIRDKHTVAKIKRQLFELLIQEHAFWSYEPASINIDIIDDDQIIALTLRYLDIPDINRLFTIYPKRKIKNAWKNHLVPESEFLYTLNRFLAWYYFKAKNPDTYIKNLQTRHLNHLIGA